MKDRVHLPVLSQPSPAPSGDLADGDLPEISQAELDWDDVDCVLADLDDFTEIREMLGRGADGKPTAIDDIVVARDQFVSGHWHGLQITYAFADEVWIDTLLREPSGAKLLRMAAPR